MSQRQHPGRVEDYTQPFLITSGVTLFMGFWVLASLMGFFAVVICAAAIDLVLKLVWKRSGAFGDHGAGRL